MNTLDSKNYERKVKSPFMIYANFESILVPEVKANSEESYTNKYQNHVASSYGYKLVSVYDKFIVFITLRQRFRYCSDVLKKHFNKELVMTKETNENFETSTTCWICDNSLLVL